ncbi:hypothetical protein ACFYQ5_04060 [Streptomyces sp. NPDC005794]|uniref:hypothetical protein n=1 Tax=Streptomyces sp. NPDC005794 TaxID=3364733 RepID=UPI00367B5415
MSVCRGQRLSTLLLCTGRAIPRDEPDEDAEIVKNLLSLRAAINDDCRARILAVVRDGRYRLAATLAAGPGAVMREHDDVIVITRLCPRVVTVCTTSVKSGLPNGSSLRARGAGCR